MQCNTARTQCTIGLARRPCQKLTGWTELCQSHYDNEYNTYAHEIVWKKIGGVWRRSLGGGSTCAETPWKEEVSAPPPEGGATPGIRPRAWGVLGHSEVPGLKIAVEPKPLQSLIIMTTNSTTISEPVQVSTVGFYVLLCGWLCYCHTGSLSVSQPLRFLIVLQGYAKLIFGHFWIRRWEVALSLFASYLMGRVSIDWRRTLMVALLVCVDTIALVLEILLSGPHATRRAPAKIVTAIMEALLAFGVIAYLGQLTLSLKGQGKWIWVAKLACLGAWSLEWGVLSLLYWLQLTSDLAIMVWLMTCAALFHYSAVSPRPRRVTLNLHFFAPLGWPPRDGTEK
ncbi:hypothetical protein XENOCAPTIV_025666 [Xenoophorus captivus]|uniref:Transmembrane protein n=1 Tax=Xenoophorus captivus TaxID=1517983 RepID=A0ABV0SBA8_9TELE